MDWLSRFFEFNNSEGSFIASFPAGESEFPSLTECRDIFSRRGRFPGPWQLLRDVFPALFRFQNVHLFASQTVLQEASYGNGGPSLMR